MNEKKGLVVTYYPGCGGTYLEQFHDDGIKIKKLDQSKYRTEIRHPNDLEVEQYRNRIEEHNWLMGPDFLVEKYKKSDIISINPDYPKNYIKAIEEATENYDIVLIYSDKTIKSIMYGFGIRFITIYPKNNLLNEYLGRLFNKYKDAKMSETTLYFKLKSLYLTWKNDMESVESENNGLELIRLEYDEYISDIMEYIEFRESIDWID